MDSLDLIVEEVRMPVKYIRNQAHRLSLDVKGDFIWAPIPETSDDIMTRKWRDKTNER